MNNYEYIIASLPLISSDGPDSSPDSEAIIGEILELLSEKDRKTAGFLLSSYGYDVLCREFYEKAFKSGNGFIRKYFKADLDARNAKVSYLNRELGRPEGTDCIEFGDSDEEDLAVLETILAKTDILDREKSLDDYMWAKVDGFTEFHIFDLDLILGFIVKLKTIDRWLKLDKERGRKLFGEFVQEIRKNKNI